MTFIYLHFQEPTYDHLLEAQNVIIYEQRDLTHEVAHSTISIQKINKRLKIMKRVFTALSNRYCSGEYV